MNLIFNILKYFFMILGIFTFVLITLGIIYSKYEKKKKRRK